MATQTHWPIQATGLTKVYRDRDWLGRLRQHTALADLALTLAPGEAFGLIGPNGAGKSTALKLLMGLTFPSEGSLRINGRPLSDPQARQGVGFIPEEPALYEQLSAFEIVYGAARMQGLARGPARAQAYRLLETVGLSAQARVPVRKLSRGMLQRTAIAHALAGNPNLLIADEPLTALDPLWRKAVVELFRELRDGGGTILFSSHILADVERLADRVALLYAGRLQTISTPAQLVTQNGAHYLIRTHGGSFPRGLEATQEAESQWALEATGEHLQPVLSQLEAQGHCLIEIRPADAGLEQAVTQFLEEARPREELEGQLSPAQREGTLE